MPAKKLFLSASLRVYLCVHHLSRVLLPASKLFSIKLAKEQSNISSSKSFCQTTIYSTKLVKRTW